MVSVKRKDGEERIPWKGKEIGQDKVTMQIKSSVSIRIKSTLITIIYRIKGKNCKYGYEIAWKCENLIFGRDDI